MNYSEHLEGAQGICFIRNENVDAGPLTFTAKCILNYLFVERA